MTPDATPEQTLTMPVVAEDTETMPALEAVTETLPVQAPEPEPAARDDDWRAALAAAVAAVNEEVEQRTAANLASIAESCEALDIELNAYVADAIKGRADYVSDACQRRGTLCQQSRSIVWAPQANHPALVAATLERVPMPAAMAGAWTAPLPLYDGSREGNAA